jgi:hypothetical protein
VAARTDAGLSEDGDAGKDQVPHVAVDRALDERVTPKEAVEVVLARVQRGCFRGTHESGEQPLRIGFDRLFVVVVAAEVLADVEVHLGGSWVGFSLRGEHDVPFVYIGSSSSTPEPSMATTLKYRRDVDPEMGLDLLALGVGDAFSAVHYSTCLALRAEGRWLLVDCPHPIRKMMREASLRGGIELDIDGVEAVALTHLHADHASGTPWLRTVHRRDVAFTLTVQGAPRAQRTAGRLRARGCARRC